MVGGVSYEGGDAGRISAGGLGVRGLSFGSDDFFGRKGQRVL